MRIKPLRHLLVVCALAGCTGVPEGVEVVDGFELDRYLGTWYEIARLDHRFERGLTHVTAEYSLKEDGGVRVVNRGLDGSAWKESVGKAYFVENADVGRLKVSFFGPFYGGYNIAVLDADYQYAMVVGPSRSYLWVLARTPEMEPERLQELVDHARTLGFPVDELIYVTHDVLQD